MFRKWAKLCFLSLLLVRVHADGDEMGDKEISIEDAMDSFIKNAKTTRPDEEDKLQDLTSSHYEQLIHFANIIGNLVNDKINAYTFLEKGGIDTIIVPYVTLFDLKLRTEMLIMIKNLFTSAPTTAKAMAPPILVDKIVDIFVTDSDEGVKARALDILYIWLPNNPKVQARVMRVNGLEPFYEQALKLDSTGVYIVLDLFNKILDEHIQIRKGKRPQNEADVAKLNIYKKIGLIERMSHPQTCNGMLNILQEAWGFRYVKPVGLPIFNLLQKFKNPCARVFKRARAVQFFENMIQDLQKSRKKNEEVVDDKLNETDFQIFLTTYIEKLKTKEEL